MDIYGVVDSTQQCYNQLQYYLSPQISELVLPMTFGHGIWYVVACQNLIDDKTLLSDTLLDKVISDPYKF